MDLQAHDIRECKHCPAGLLPTIDRAACGELKKEIDWVWLNNVVNLIEAAPTYHTMPYHLDILDTSHGIT